MLTPLDRTRFSDYCRAKMIDLNTKAKITKHGMFRFVGGRWITQSEFLKNNPVEIRKTMRSLTNPDKTKVQ